MPCSVQHITADCKVRKTFFPCGSASLTARGSKALPRQPVLQCSRCVAVAGRWPLQLPSSPRGSRWAAFRNRPGEGLEEGSCLQACLASVMLDWMGTTGGLCFWLAGEVLWIVTGFVHSDSTRAATCLNPSHFSLSFLFLLKQGEVSQPTTLAVVLAGSAFGKGVA